MYRSTLRSSAMLYSALLASVVGTLLPNMASAHEESIVVSGGLAAGDSGDLYQYFNLGLGHTSLQLQVERAMEGGLHGGRIASDAYGISTLDMSPDNAIFQISTIDLHYSQATDWEASLTTQAGSGVNVLSLFDAPTSRLYLGPYGAMGYDNDLQSLFLEDSSNWDIRGGVAFGFELGEVVEFSGLYSQSIYASQVKSNRLSAHATLDLGVLSTSAYIDNEMSAEIEETTVRLEAGLCF